MKLPRKYFGRYSNPYLFCPVHNKRIGVPLAHCWKNLDRDHRQRTKIIERTSKAHPLEVNKKGFSITDHHVLGLKIPVHESAPSRIAQLLTKDLLKLVIVSILIASPIAWWAMNKWLQSFAYRINMSWWIFIAAAGTALLIAFIRVSSQAIKAALANPVKSLRTEQSIIEIKRLC